MSSINNSSFSILKLGKYYKFKFFQRSVDRSETTGIAIISLFLRYDYQHFQYIQKYFFLMEKQLSVECR